MIHRTVLILGILFFSAPALVFGQPGYRQGQASAGEVLMLPRFCWWEYNAAFKDTALEIQGCGVGMNHYCSALVEFNRAKSTLDRFKKGQKLNVALRGVEYTLSWMKDYPGCSIRQHVEKTYASVRMAFANAGNPVPPDRFSNQWGSQINPRSGPGEAPSRDAEKAQEEVKPTTDTKQEQVSKPAGQASDLSAGAVRAARETQPASTDKSVAPSAATEGEKRLNPWCRFCPEEDHPPHPAASNPPAEPTAAP
jgi:hypothetical protein